MQCQSYFTLPHSIHDLNMDLNGAAMPLYNGNGNFRSGHYNKYVSSSSVPQGPLESLRQTILMQEATFRDQVQELHRLYRRQKELIGQVRSKELYMNHLQLEGQSSNSFPKYSSNGFQNTLHSLPLFNMHCNPTNVGTCNIQMPVGSIREHRTPATSVVSQNGDSLSMHCLETKGRKIGKKFLDLELPAEVYIDCEGESLEDAKFPEAPMPTSLSSNTPSKVVAGTGPVPSSAMQGIFPSPSSLAWSNTNFADLNEPTTASCSEKNDGIIGNEGRSPDLDLSQRNHDPLNNGKARSDGASATGKLLAHRDDNANSEVCSGSSWRKTSTILEKNPCVVQALPCSTNQISSSKGARSRYKSSKNSCCDSNFKDSMASLSSITSDHLMRVNGLNYIDLNSDVVANTEFTPSSAAKAFNEVDGKGKDVILSESGFSEVDGTLRKRKKCRLIDINLPCDPSTDEEVFTEDDMVEGAYKKSAQMNLCMNDDGSLPMSSCSRKLAFEIDLEAPPSPDVQECPPPRGDSEENHPETSQVSTPKDGGDPLEVLAKVAAEAIVYISSSSKSRPYLEIRDLQKCEASESGTLEWFAGLIPSIAHDLDNDIETLSYDDSCGFDEFEAMTLQLTEMKEEEYWCKNSAQITCSMPMAATQARKGRTRRSKGKDFQREVLPSLASLSRYEVTEDIQIIEGLMEAAGTPWHLTRGRRACRMGRKPRAAKQPNPSTSVVPDLKGSAPTLMSWGKANRKPRERRSPASPTTVLTRWLAFSA